MTERKIDKSHCKEIVWRGPWDGGSQCDRKPVRDGLCLQHHPDSKKARQEAESERRAKRRKQDALWGLSEITDKELLAEVKRRGLKIQKEQARPRKPRKVKKKRAKSGDDCPVRGCNARVPGIDTSEMIEGTHFACRSGHHSVVACEDEEAWLVYTGTRTKKRASK